MALSILNSSTPCKIFPKISKLKNFVDLNRYLTQSFKSQPAENKPVLPELEKVRIKEIQKKFRYKDIVKLIGIQKAYRLLLKPGCRVLEIGAAPGSWLLYLANKTNSNGRDSDKPTGIVIAIDIDDVKCIEGVHCLPFMDFLKESTQLKVAEILGDGEKFDFVFSDITPPLTGRRSFDRKRMTKIVFCLCIFLTKHLETGGSFLAKINGTDKDTVKQGVKNLFRVVNFIYIKKPYRCDFYLLGRDFRIGT